MGSRKQSELEKFMRKECKPGSGIDIDRLATLATNKGFEVLCYKIFEEEIGRVVEIIVTDPKTKMSFMAKISKLGMQKQMVLDMDEREIYLTNNMKEEATNKVLTEVQRNEMVEVLVKRDVDNIVQDYSQYKEWEYIGNILENGFGGYKNMTDIELRNEFEEACDCSVEEYFK
jgi:hypothetical protein